MSLSFLLPSKGDEAVDSELDSLFKTNTSVAGPSSRPAAAASSQTTAKSTKETGKKRKGDVQVTEEPTKRRKGDSQNAAAAAASPKPKVKETKTTEKKKAAKKDKKGKAKVPDDEELEEENSDVENAYLKVRDRQPAEASGRPDVEQPSEGEGGDDDDDDDDDKEGDIPLHESLKKDRGSSSRSGPKTKYVPPNETPEQRNQRTIFIGNLSANVAQKRPLQKQLHRHILQFITTAKIESARFRSVAFATPTADLDNEPSDGKPTKPSGTSDSSSKSTRQHDLHRASAWRDRQEDESIKNDEKKFLTPSQKKKIAFINQEFHSTADTVNAYIVFAHPISSEQRPANLPPPPEVMDPYTAARMAAMKSDGTIFMERSIRVDLVGVKGGAATTGTKEDGATEELALVGADPKLSVFVGNLDFASKEDDLRVFFEGVVTAEKGAPPSGDENTRNQGWVTRVRIVRDKDTQMGKGFAYVQFADRECVDEILAMEEGKLKFAKRKLRVQRCKTLPGSSASTRQITAEKKKTEQGSAKQSAPTPIVIPSVPKGDPRLGEKLAGLSKDARKQAKATDADRVARRLAKKKARNAMQAKGGPGVKAGDKDGKERVRVRKSGKVPGGSVSGKPKVKTVKSGKVRSEKAISKMNRKKSG